MLMKSPVALLFVAIAAAWAGEAASSPSGRVVLPSVASPKHYAIAVVPDADKLVFSASAAIDLDVSRATDTLVLNALDLTFVSAKLDRRSDSPAIAFDAARQTATLKFRSPIPAGRHRLSIAYRGKIGQQGAGLFALDYKGTSGPARALFTQLENSDARRFFPCWDEPGRKATFSLTVDVPRGEMAVSNMPIANVGKLADGAERVQFATTPPMSTYLVFLAVGDFERVSQTVDGIDVGVIVKRGDADKAGFALDAATHLLPYYHAYFASKFPLPKLDLVTAPGTAQFFGAMENWGAILFYEKPLMIDPGYSTEADKRAAYIDIAHEISHQWFGDLVTMQWWDDLWLNEGFASWMELKATDKFHPEWHVWLDALEAKERAMRVDAKAGTHPIIQPIRDVLDANSAFDEITYQKGESVVRMLENYAGQTAFQDGVRAYIKAHAFGNTTTEDLWRALDKSSATPLSPVAHDFTLQAGVPLLRVSRDGGALKITTDRFTSDGMGAGEGDWSIPVRVKEISSSREWRPVVSRQAPAEIDGVQDAIVNAGQYGYFRTLYSADLLRPILADFDLLPAEDQLGLVNDLCALGFAGYEPLTDFLELAQKANGHTDPAVLTTLVSRLKTIDGLYADGPQRLKFRQFANGLLLPIFEDVGWTPTAGEPQATSFLRAALFATLSQFGNSVVIDGARQRFAASLKDPSVLTGDLHHNVIRIVAEHADANTWDTLRDLAAKASNSLEQRDIYSQLGRTFDPQLAARTMDLALGDDAPRKFRLLFIQSVALDHPDLALDFATRHWDKISEIVDADSRDEFVPDLLVNASDRNLIARLKAFASANIPAGADQEAIKIEATIAENADIREKRLSGVDRWLASR
jgi:aminopeptidase N